MGTPLAPQLFIQIKLQHYTSVFNRGPSKMPQLDIALATCSFWIPLVHQISHLKLGVLKGANAWSFKQQGGGGIRERQTFVVNVTEENLHVALNASSNDRKSRWNLKSQSESLRIYQQAIAKCTLYFGMSCFKTCGDHVYYAVQHYFLELHSNFFLVQDITHALQAPTGFS